MKFRIIEDSKNIYAHAFYKDLMKKIPYLHITYPNFKKIYKRSKIIYCYNETKKFVGYVIYEIIKKVKIYNQTLFINPIYLHYAVYKGNTRYLLKELAEFLDRENIIFTHFIWYRLKKGKHFILKINRNL